MGFLKDQNPTDIISQVTGPKGQVDVVEQIPGTQTAGGAPRKRKRVSALDVIGTLADIGAEWGGLEGGYAQGVERRRQKEQQDREIAQFENKAAWDQKFNEQKYAEANAEAQDRSINRMGQVAQGLHSVFQNSGVEGLNQAFPVVSQAMGLNPQETEIFRQAMTSDPGSTLQVLSSIGASGKTGSQAKELAIHQMLTNHDRKNGTDFASEYLKQVATGVDTAMTPYQEGQLDVARERNRISRYRAMNPPVKAAPTAAAAKAEAEQNAIKSAATSARGILQEFRQAFGVLKDKGGINTRGQSLGQRVAAAGYENVPLMERLTNPDAFSARQDIERLRTQGLSSLLPLLGGLKVGGKNIDAAKELDTWRKAIASASDYESAMRALDGFDRRVQEILSQADKGPTSSPQAPRRRVAPRPSGGAASPKRLKYNPATGRIE